MITVLLIVHLLVTLALIGVVLIQRSEGGGLGVGSTQGMGSFMSGRGTANLLTRSTAILGTLFFVLSMTLALLNRSTSVHDNRSIFDVQPTPTVPNLPTLPLTPGTPPAQPAPVTPAATAPTTSAPAPTAPSTTAPSTTAPSTTAPSTTAPAASAPAPATVPPAPADKPAEQH